VSLEKIKSKLIFSHIFVQWELANKLKV